MIIWAIAKALYSVLYYTMIKHSINYPRLWVLTKMQSRSISIILKHIILFHLILSGLKPEGVYGSLRKEWEDKGVIFTDLDTAVQEHPDLVKDYYCRAIPPSDFIVRMPYKYLTKGTFAGPVRTH